MPPAPGRARRGCRFPWRCVPPAARLPPAPPPHDNPDRPTPRGASSTDLHSRGQKAPPPASPVHKRPDWLGPLHAAPPPPLPPEKSRSALPIRNPQAAPSQTPELPTLPARPPRPAPAAAAPPIGSHKCARPGPGPADLNQPQSPATRPHPPAAETPTARRNWAPAKAPSRNEWTAPPPPPVARYPVAGVQPR